MTRRCIAAHTAVGGTYPAYVSINYDEAREVVEIDIRGKHHIDDMGASPGFGAHIEMSPFDFRRLMEATVRETASLPDIMRKAASPPEGRIP